MGHTGFALGAVQAVVYRIVVKMRLAMMDTGTVVGNYGSSEPR